LSWNWVTIDGVWIGNRIHLHTERNYKYVRQSHSVKHYKVHCNYITDKAFPFFISLCLVTALNCGRSPSSRFPKWPQP
jgi:hypothetical protein